MNDTQCVALAFGGWSFLFFVIWFSEKHKESRDHQQRHLVWFRKSLRAISRSEPLEAFEERDRWCKLCQKADRIRIQKKG